MRMIGVLAVALLVLAVPVGADAYDRLVNPFHSCSLSGVPEYQSIQAAVNAASPGDQIGVCPGSYVEATVVTTSVTLAAIGSVSITTPVAFVVCIDVQAPDVTIRYFTIQHCPNVALVLRSTGAVVQNNHLQFNGDGSTIKNNTIRRTLHGIIVLGDGVIVNKKSVQDSDTGILGILTSDSTISFNTVSFNGVGIDLSSMGSNDQVSRNVVTKNAAVDCTWDGSGGVTFSKNTCGTEIPAGAWD